jgi:hypothetical protein
MDTESLLKKLADSDGFIWTSGLSRAEFKALHSAEDVYDVVKLKKGLYVLTSEIPNLQFDVEKRIPGGILCMWSAWDYYKLSVEYPPGVCVAVDNHRHVNLPEDSFFKLYYRSGSALTLGVTELEENGKKFKIYDRERCVCDAVRYRNKIGLDTMADILRMYFRDTQEKPNINKLLNYAGQLGVEKYLKIIINYEFN